MAWAGLVVAFNSEYFPIQEDSSKEIRRGLPFKRCRARELNIRSKQSTSSKVVK